MLHSRFWIIFLGIRGLGWEQGNAKCDNGPTGKPLGRKSEKESQGWRQEKVKIKSLHDGVGTEASCDSCWGRCRWVID